MGSYIANIDVDPALWTKDELLTAIVLFALSNCAGDRRNFKHKGQKIPLRQAEVALEIFDHILPNVETDLDTIYQVSRWLSIKGNKIASVRRCIKGASAQRGLCHMCFTRAYHCQIPKDFKPALQDVGPGWCVITGVRRYVKHGVYNVGTKPTGLELINLGPEPTGWTIIDNPDAGP
jgi:hypothetical protein